MSISNVQSVTMFFFSLLNVELLLRAPYMSIYICCPLKETNTSMPTRNNLLGCDAPCSGRSFLTFGGIYTASIFSINTKLRSKHSAYASTLKMETACSSETSLNFYQSTKHHILEDNTFHSHCHKNPKSHRDQAYIQISSSS